MKALICPICYNKDNNTQIHVKERLIWIREVFNYWQCWSCSTVFLLDEIKDFSPYYPKIYHNNTEHIGPLWKQYAMKKVLQYNAQKNSTIWFFIWKAFRKINWYWPEPALAWIGNALQILKNTKSINNIKDAMIIDIGCGWGILLSQLEKQWFKNIYGIEPFADNIKPYIQKIDIDRFIDNEGEHAKYDIVLLSHVLEHIYDHEKMLHKLMKLLTPNWILVIAMPFIWKTFSKYWESTMYLDAPRHLIIHSIKSFRALVQKVWLSIRDELYEQSYRDIAASEMYQLDINFFEWRELWLLEVNKKTNLAFSNAINRLQWWWSSATFYLSKK